MNKYTLLSILESYLKEIVDIYDIRNLPKGVTNLDIKTENRLKFFVDFIYKDTPYSIFITNLKYNYPTVLFGNREEGGRLNATELLNVPESKVVLSVVFSLLKYWLEKYKIPKFCYEANGDVKQSLYRKYMEKHFKNYELTDTELTNLFIWTRI